MRAVSDFLTERHLKLTNTLEELESRLTTTCKALQNANSEFKFRFIEGRVKDVASMRRAIGHDPCEENEFWGINDIIGARVVVPTQSDVDLAVNQILLEIPWQWTAKRMDDDESGYRGTHLKALRDVDGVGVGCEVQVRTILTDAWSWLSKEFFHHQATERPWDSMMKLIADHMKATDGQLQLVRDQMKDLQNLPPKVNPQIVTDPNSAPQPEANS